MVNMGLADQLNGVLVGELRLATWPSTDIRNLLGAGSSRAGWSEFSFLLRAGGLLGATVALLVLAPLRTG
jgi:hypothetical protein